jgi:hypothetical protein
VNCLLPNLQDVMADSQSTAEQQQSLLLQTARSAPGVAGIMKELDRLQGEQVQLARKIEREKRRKEALALDLESARVKLRTYQDATKGGSIVKEEDTISRKTIAKLEYSLQQSRIRLSSTHKDNAAMKRRIDETRQNKIMHLNILRNLEREYQESKAKIASQQKEIIEVNEEKHRIDVKISSLQEQMLHSLNVFSNELSMAKQNISSTQTNILDSIRERLQNTFNNLDLLEEETSVDRSPVVTVKRVNEAEERRVALQELLDEVGVDSLEKLIVTLQQSEEVIFAKYNDTQASTSEVERLELENKHLQTQVESQIAELQELESSNETKQRDLEISIASIKRSTEKAELQVAQSEEALSLMHTNLISLFKNIAIDEALDQQILETGVNERNIPDYLGIVEQRIDELIQMRKAAEHQLLEREDFGKSAFRKMQGSLVRPTLPDSRVEAPDDDMGTEDDGSGRVLPVNIDLLKDFMNKKVQRTLKKKDLAEALAKAGKGGFGGRGEKQPSATSAAAAASAAATSTAAPTSASASTPASAADVTSKSANFDTSSSADTTNSAGRLRRQQHQQRHPTVAERRKAARSKIASSLSAGDAKGETEEKRGSYIFSSGEAAERKPSRNQFVSFDASSSSAPSAPFAPQEPSSSVPSRHSSSANVRQGSRVSNSAGSFPVSRRGSGMR